MTTETQHERTLLRPRLRLAWYGGWLSILVGILHSLARFATAAGHEDLSPVTRLWADPVRRLLEPLLTFWTSTASTSSTGCSGARCSSWRSAAPSSCGATTWQRASAGVSGGRGVRTSPATACSPSGASAPTTAPGSTRPWSTAPSRRSWSRGSSSVAGTWLRVVLVYRGFRPRVTAVLVALVVPCMFAVSSMMSLGSGFIPLLIAWGCAGRAITSNGSTARTTTGKPAGSPPRPPDGRRASRP